MSDLQRKSFGSDSKVPDLILQGKYSQEAITAEREKQDALDARTSEEILEPQLTKLPQPTGYRILLLPYTLKAKTKGGIILTGDTIQQEQLATTVAYVVDMGPDAYGDTAKFPDGPWCKKGDYVLFGRYAGAKITMNGGETGNLPLRLLNDDEILAVISNPEDYVGTL